MTENRQVGLWVGDERIYQEVKPIDAKTITFIKDKQ